MPRFLNRRYPDKGFRALEDSLCTRSGMPQETQVFSPNKCRSIFSVPCFVSVKTILFKSRLYSPVFFSPRSCRPLQTKQRRVPQGSRMHATRGESLLQLPERIQGGWLYVPSSKSLRWRVQRRLPWACHLHCHRTCKLNDFSHRQGSLRHFFPLSAESIFSGWITLCTAQSPCFPKQPLRSSRLLSTSVWYPFSSGVRNSLASLL